MRIWTQQTKLQRAKYYKYVQRAKGNYILKIKDRWVAITHRNINKEMEINNRKPMEILKLKSTLTEIKTILKDSIVDLRWQRKNLVSLEIEIMKSTEERKME